jgi:hypothetical protein
MYIYICKQMDIDIGIDLDNRYSILDIRYRY